jgi:hypothetical protein
VDELLAAVNSALSGCGGSPSAGSTLPTPTMTPPAPPPPTDPPPPPTNPPPTATAFVLPPYGFPY